MSGNGAGDGGEEQSRPDDQTARDEGAAPAADAMADTVTDAMEPESTWQRLAGGARRCGRRWQRCRSRRESARAGGGAAGGTPHGWERKRTTLQVVRKFGEGLSIAGGGSALFFDVIGVFAPVPLAVKWTITAFVAVIGAVVSGALESQQIVDVEVERQQALRERQTLLELTRRTQLGVQKLDEKLREWRRHRLIARPPSAEDLTNPTPTPAQPNQLDAALPSPATQAPVAPKPATALVPAIQTSGATPFVREPTAPTVDRDAGPRSLPTVWTGRDEEMAGDVTRELGDLAKSTHLLMAALDSADPYVHDPPGPLVVVSDPAQVKRRPDVQGREDARTDTKSYALTSRGPRGAQTSAQYVQLAVDPPADHHAPPPVDDHEVPLPTLDADLPLPAERGPFDAASIYAADSVRRHVLFDELNDLAQRDSPDAPPPL